MPTFVSTLSICIVFVPMFLLTGVARYLFVPLAEAVIFAMIASYFFSRTLVPTLAMALMRAKGHGRPPRVFARLARFQAAFEHRFEAVRLRYRALLAAAIARRRRFAAAFLLACVASTGLFAFAGDFFPSVDTGEILHLRAPTGTRIETARLTDEVEAKIRGVIPADQLAGVLDNIGVPVSGINLTYDASDPIGTGDADVLITLKPNHASTAAYVATLRNVLAQSFPGVTFAFLPADIVSQILNFGLPAPIDIQIVGNKLDQNRAVANALLAKLRGVRVDARIQQPGDEPAIDVNVDRTKAIPGLQQRDVAQNLLIALSGSSQTTPNFWLDPRNGVSYPVLVQTPQYTVNSLQALANVPLPSGTAPRRRRRPAARRPAHPRRTCSARSAASRAPRSRRSCRTTTCSRCSTSSRRCRARPRRRHRRRDDTRRRNPRATAARLVDRAARQVQAMHESFTGLLGGLVLAVALVYLLMVVNFQSWLDPLVIVGGLPASLAGIAWILFVTRTTLSVPALTGTILCIGIATANSILVVNTARELLAGARRRGRPRWTPVQPLPPVLMTALAMLIGMLPMALGLGDGGEQNAPLGRAVIGDRVRHGVDAAVRAGRVRLRPRMARPASRGRTARSAPPIRRRWADRAAALPSDSSNLGIMNDSIEPLARRPPTRPPCRKHDRTRGRPPGSREASPDAPHRRRARRLTVPLAAVALAAALLAIGIVPRIDAPRARAQVAAQQALPVSVIAPGTAPADQTLTLPGSVMPFAEASIYARTSGYIAHWSADLGAHVKAGQPLAQIAAPDLDAQLRRRAPTRPPRRRTTTMRNRPRSAGRTC